MLAWKVRFYLWTKNEKKKYKSFHAQENIGRGSRGGAPAGAGSEQLAGAAAPPGPGYEFVAGAAAPAGAGSEYFAGAAAPAGAGSKYFAGAAAPPGAGSETWPGQTAPPGHTPAPGGHCYFVQIV